MLYLKQYQGLGNVYLLFDPRKTDGGLDAARIQLVCSRNFGVGSDGILVGPLPGEGWQLRIFNPDGTEADSGVNAAMIFARYLRDGGYLTDSKVRVVTKGCTLQVEFLDNAGEAMRLVLPAPDFSAAAVPMLGQTGEVVDAPLTLQGQTLHVTCLYNGAPHCVLFLPEVSRELAFDLGPRLQASGLFPEGINVVLIARRDAHTLVLESYERGAGYTLSSGSAAAAAASAAVRLGLCEAEMDLCMPGGTMKATVLPEGRVELVGRVEAGSGLQFTEEEICAALSL